jgi:hypothetical protein
VAYNETVGAIDEACAIGIEVGGDQDEGGEPEQVKEGEEQMKEGKEQEEAHEAEEHGDADTEKAA